MRRHPWLVVGVLCLLAIVAGGTVAGFLVAGGDDVPATAATVAPANDPPAARAAEGPPYRLFVGQVARDDLLRLVIGGLATDRSAPERLRLWVGGDSTSVYMGAALAAAARAGGGSVAGEKYTISSGLSRPDFFDWPSHVTAEVERTNPNVVVLMVGANDAQGMTSADGRVVSSSALSAEWKAEYARRVAAVMEGVSAPGRLVVWVGQPVMGPSDYNERMRALSAIFREQAAAHPGVVYFDSYALFAEGSGQYQVSLGSVTMRTSDGIHFTTQGGAYLADAILAEIRARKELEIDG